MAVSCSEQRSNNFVFVRESTRSPRNPVWNRKATRLFGDLSATVRPRCGQQGRGRGPRRALLTWIWAP